MYDDLTREFGAPAYERIDAPATPAQKEMLAKLSPEQFNERELAGEKIVKTSSHRPGKRRTDRRNQGDRGERMVRRAAVGHRRCLQDLCGELSRSRSLRRIQAEAQELIARVFKQAESNSGN